MPAHSLLGIPRNPIVAGAGVGMVAALSVMGALKYYRAVDNKTLGYEASWTEDVISIGRERFRGVVAMLPPDAVLGYVSDLPVSSTRGQVWLFGARDALAPRIIAWPETAQKEDCVLGNFSKPVDLAQIEEQNRLNLVRDFGSGVVVFGSR